jgi:hypothetical protein
MFYYVALILQLPTTKVIRQKVDFLVISSSRPRSKEDE